MLRGAHLRISQLVSNKITGARKIGEETINPKVDKSSELILGVASIIAG